MTIDVSKVLKEVGSRIDVDCTVNPDKIDFLGGIYEFVAPITVKGSIKNNGGSLAFAAECASTFNTQCARCGKDTEAVLTFIIDENLMQNDGEDHFDEDVILFDGYTVEIDDIVISNFLMNENGKHLCSENCKGLCPKCGCNLNERQCDCSNDNIDPRWTGLLEIMKNED